MKTIILTIVVILVAITIVFEQNLITNSSFETSGQLNCQSWYDGCGKDFTFLCDTIAPDTIFCGTDFYQDTPSGGGIWCIRTTIGMRPPYGFAQTYVTGLSLSAVFQLKYWMFTTGDCRGYREISKISQGRKTNISLVSHYPVLSWNQYTILDTLTLTSNDTISIKFWPSDSPVDHGSLQVDLVELTILDTLSVVSEENLNSISKDIKIYPNPFSSRTKLQTNNILNNATLKLINCFGQTIKQMKNISGRTITINRDNIPSGLYFLHLTQDNKTLMVHKLLITEN